MAVGLALLVALAGCGAGRSAQTAEQVRLTPGAGGRVGSVAVRDAKIAFTGEVPEDAVYRVGDDAPLQLTVVNEGTEPDELVTVRSTIATRGTVAGDARMPGGHVVVTGYDRPPASATLPQETALVVTLVDLTTSIRSGLTYPVEFVFARAGVLRLELPVEVPSEVPPPRADPSGAVRPSGPETVPR